MKKTILLFAVFASVMNVNAQKAVEVDPHAGHNHAKEVVQEVVKATATPVAVKNAIKKPQGKAAVAKAVSTDATPQMAQIVSTPTTEVVSPVMLPETLVSKEVEFDFGKIPQGKPVTHVFTVTNTSKAPYKLDNVQASCGCTTPEWEREKMIAPGESVDIKVGFNAGAVAPFTKPVTITYNGTQTKVLNIKGEVYATPATSAPANVEAAEIKK